MDTQSLILVVCDPLVGYYEDLNFQVLGKARNLSLENCANIICIYWGGDREYAKVLLSYGAKKVMLCNYDVDDYTIYSKIVKLIIDEYNPSLVLFTGTGLGKAIAATVATLAGAGLVADCIDIQLRDKNKYIFSRAALSSSIIASIVCTDDSIQMCTIKPNVFTQCVKRIETEQESIEEYNCDVSSDFADYIQIVGSKEIESEEHCNLDKSKIIFAVGRGVSDDDFEEIKKLAIHYGAEIGGTRIMVEKGKIPKSRQIGQSGINVTPNLYIAFGISGATQHIAGIQNAKNVIAINNDENASIFEYADYGIISDVHDVIKNFIGIVKGGKV